MTENQTADGTCAASGGSSLSAQKQRLFTRQKALLDTFLGTGAITPAQYRKSLTCLAEKMGIPLTEPLP